MGIYQMETLFATGVTTHRVSIRITCLQGVMQIT